VAVDDLSSISGMEDKHRRALARRQITTLRGLADADQQVIYRAMGNIRPRPTLKQIAKWQGEARSRLDEVGGRDEAPVRAGARGQDEATADTADWHPAASFAVVFAQRRAGDSWERRIEVERTEVEPEREPEVWPGWECNPICGWMLSQLGQADQAGSAGPGESAQGGGGQAQGAGSRPASGPQAPAMSPADLPQLRIDSAVIIDAVSRADVVTAGALAPDPPAEVVAPVLVAFTVSGARPGTQVQAVARFRGRQRPGRNAADPVAVPASGRAEFGLPEAGQVELALLAWAPDGSARPVSVRLPAISIGPGGAD
jgi:hypothetical protein